MPAARWILTSVVTLLLVMSPTAAHAEDPLDLSARVTDSADVLDDDADRVETAVQEFFDATGRQLFVVYVSSFDGLRGSEWARQTATRSALGPTDVVLVVATSSRSWGFAADPEEITGEELRAIDTERVEPALREEDWAGAAEGAAEGLAEATEGTGIPWPLVLAGILLAAGAAAFTVTRLRRRFDHTHHVVDEHGRPLSPATLLSDEELETTAAAALVAADDALWTSEREVERLEPGTADALRPVVADSRALLAEAFVLQQRLDDATAVDDDARRRDAARIIELCEQVDAALDAHAAQADAVRADSPAAVRRELQDLAVDGSAPASLRVAAGLSEVTRAEAALADDDRDAATGHLRAARQLADQARVLTTADDEAGTVAALVESHRGAVGVTARTRLATGRLQEARQAAEADVAQWTARRTTEREAGRPVDDDEATLRLAGVLVPALDEDGLLDRLEPDEPEPVLGASPRVSRTAYRGSTRRHRHAPGRFGGSRTRGRRGPLRTPS